MREEFDRLADERWERGVREIRGGDSSKPFDGDPVAEGEEECLDARNYAREGARQGRLTWGQAKVASWLAYTLFMIFRSAR